MFELARSGFGISEDVERWLRADPRDVVRIEPRGTGDHGPGGRPALDLDAGLARWQRRLRRARARVLARRGLILALAVAVVLELILLLTGRATGTRALLLIVPAALALLAFAIEVRHGPSRATVAVKLDHDLALAERLGTALELEPDTETQGRDGLQRRVLTDATTQIGQSLGTARAVQTPARREWAATAALVAVTAALVAIPAASSASPGRTAAASRHHATASVTPGARIPASHAGATGTHTTTSSSGHQPPALGFGNLQNSPEGTNRELARGPSAGKPSSGGLPKQLAKGGNGQVGPGEGAGAGQSGQSATAGLGPKSSAAPGGQASNGSASSGAAPHTKVGGAGGHSASGAKAGAGSANSPGKSGSSSATKSSGSQGAFRSRKAPPGGETAGSGRGSTAESRHAGKSTAQHAPGGLPIQSGYTPGRSSKASGKEGNSQTSGGGLGPARGANASAGLGASGGKFPYIPSTPNSISTQDENLLLSYFSSFAWLLTARW